ncbi:ankyrin repeat and SAM domain-containing protein 3 isoform X1 [Ixodes scapularis]
MACAADLETLTTPVREEPYDLELEKAILADIHTAASLGYVSRIRDLLRRTSPGDEVNVQNRGGWTPLIYAASAGQKGALEVLLKHGAAVNVQNCQGRTAAIVAAMYGHDSCLALLKKYGADLEMRDSQDRTALFHACVFGQAAIVQLLVDAGVNIHCVEHFGGYSPLAIAAAEHHESIVNILLSVNSAGHCFQGSRLLQAANLESNMSRSPVRDDAKRLPTARGKTVQPPSVQSLLHRYVNLTLGSGEPQALQKSSYSCINIPPREEVSSLGDLLDHLGLSKYHPVFQEQGIDLRTFLTFGDSELKEAGIKLVGPRRKMSVAIARWNEREQCCPSAKASPRPS